VDQLYGFEDLQPYYLEGEDGERVRNDDVDPDYDRLLAEVSAAMWSDSVKIGRTRRLHAGTYVFSDKAPRGWGHCFGQWLLEHPEFGAVVGTQTVNPNSKNLIATYLWTPNVEALSEVPAWIKGRRRAMRGFESGNWA
jgi:hypothetical protein